MIIGSDLMSDLNIDLRYSEERITWGNPASNNEYDSIPMTELGILNDKDTCQQIYNLHTDSLLLQQEEERQSKMLDAHYTKVMDSKGMFKKTLMKFKILFGGELGKVDIQPGDLEVKERTKPYAKTCYNIPKMYEKPFRTEVNRMVDVNILKRLQFHEDSPRASPSFCQMKKSEDLKMLTNFREVNKRITCNV